MIPSLHSVSGQSQMSDMTFQPGPPQLRYLDFDDSNTFSILLYRLLEGLQSIQEFVFALPLYTLWATKRLKCPISSRLCDRPEAGD